MLPTAHRLTEGDLLRRVSRRGRRAAGTAVVVHLLSGAASDADPRVGFVVSKVVGNAVVRNRVRRRLRHATASLLSSLGRGDLVVVRALPAAASLDYAALRADLVAALQRSGAVRDTCGVA